MLKLFSMEKSLNRKSLRGAALFFLFLLSVVIIYVNPSWAVNCCQNDPKLDVQRTRIAADVAAKRSLRTITREAVDAGMDIECVIAVLIDAGADPRAVVYTAIVDGYRTDKVVKGALNAKADLQLVVNAAIGAGADSTTICKGAIDICKGSTYAGISFSDCSNAIASSTLPASPVYGYSNPEPGSPSPSLFSGASAVISGGGGGGGFTIKASPHKP